MSNYVPYTDEQITRANNTDIPAMLQSIGHKVKREGANWRWVSGHDSLMIKGNEWYRNSAQSGGGGAVNFCKQYLDMNFKEAMAFLLNGEHGRGFPEMAPEQERERKFELPAANKNMRRAFAYLTKERCIDPEIASHFAHAKKIYEDADYHNVVFVGHDETGTARFACKRGTVSYAASAFRRDVAGSDKRYAFHHAGTSGRLYVFEAPIDMLSYISLHRHGCSGTDIDIRRLDKSERESPAALSRWTAHSYIALGGVSPAALNHFLKQHGNINSVCLCLDNDRAGHEAVQRIGKELQGRGYEVSAYLSHYKDWNQQLQETKQAQTQTLTTAPELSQAPALVMKGLDTP
jgi:hypothetical protein